MAQRVRRKAAEINDAALLELCRRIRKLKRLTMAERREAIEILLREIDIVRINTCENLICFKHVQELKGWSSRATLKRGTPRWGYSLYRVCCHTYYDRKQIEKRLIWDASKRVFTPEDEVKAILSP